MIIAVIVYFMTVDIETKEPRNLSKTMNLQIKKYMGRKIFIVTPKEKEQTNKIILYFHGGAYMAEATKQHWKFIEDIVKDTGATVIMPDYPLTPKHNYKDVFNMVVPLYKEIEEKIDNSKEFIIMGDSAGGGLSLALLEKISQYSYYKLPNKTILISPWLDARLNNPEIDKIQKRDKKLNKEALKISGIAYAGEDGDDSYLVNPIDGELSNLKDIIIFTGTKDILNPDVYELEKRAKEVDVKVDIREYQNASHIWLIDKDCENEVIEKGYKDLIELINN